MRRIIYQRTDGRIWIATPALNIDDPPDFTEADAERRAWNKLPADATNARFIEATEIPVDRYFRDALRLDLTTDMVKAREIHRENLRRLRQPKLEALDVEYQRADEQGDTALKAKIAVKKQALRDVTADPEIETATTPDELKAVMPAALKVVV